MTVWIRCCLTCLWPKLLQGETPHIPERGTRLERGPLLLRDIGAAYCCSSRRGCSKSVHCIWRSSILVWIDQGPPSRIRRPRPQLQPRQVWCPFWRGRVLLMKSLFCWSSLSTWSCRPVYHARTGHRGRKPPWSRDRPRVRGASAGSTLLQIWNTTRISLQRQRESYLIDLLAVVQTVTEHAEAHIIKQANQNFPQSSQ